jgi:hypothetical protein
MKKAALLIILSFFCSSYIFSQRGQLSVACEFRSAPSYIYTFVNKSDSLSFRSFYPVPESSDNAGYINYQDSLGSHCIVGDTTFLNWPDLPFVNGKISRRLDIPDEIRLPHRQAMGLNLGSIKVEANFDRIAFNYLEVCDFSLVGTSKRKAGNINSITLNNCDFNNLDFTGDSLKMLYATGCNTNDYRFTDCILDDIELFGTCQGVSFSYSKLLKNPSIYFDSLLASLEFNHCDLSDLKGLIDLTNLSRGKNKNKPTLYLYGMDISKFRFNYDDFNIYLEGRSFEEKQTFYKDLKDQYTKLGMKESYMLADIDAQTLDYENGNRFSKLTGKISWWWWHYGYDKSRILKNSTILFAVFFLINLLIGLANLLSKGYPMEKFPDKMVWWRKFFYTLLFTGFIFWGINLDKKGLNVQHLQYVFHILFQYLIGLICLAYLANYILSK